MATSTTNLLSLAAWYNGTALVSTIRRLHATALVILVPTLFCAMFVLLVGETLFQTTQDDKNEMNLPYYYYSTTHPKTAINSIANNTSTTTKLTPPPPQEPLSLAQEWREQVPWILTNTLLFAVAAVFIQAVLVRFIAQVHISSSSLSPQQQEPQSSDNEPQNEQQQQQQDANLHILRHIFWHSQRFRLLWQTAVWVQGPCILVGAGFTTAFLWAMTWFSQSLFPLSSSSLPLWMVLLLLIIIIIIGIIAMVACLVFWRHGPVLVVLMPIVVLEPCVTTVPEAWLRARALTRADPNKKCTVATTMLVVLVGAASLAATVALAVLRGMEGLAHVLATRKQVYLRTNEEEWKFCLLLGVVACLFGLSLVALPWIVVHQTILYLHLRAHDAPEEYTWTALEQDLEQTKGNVWLDEFISTATTNPEIYGISTNIEMTTYARVTRHLHEEESAIPGNTWSVHRHGD